LLRHLGPTRAISCTRRKAASTGWILQICRQEHIVGIKEDHESPGCGGKVGFHRRHLPAILLQPDQAEALIVQPDERVLYDFDRCRWSSHRQ
jgi:hypothetical protein